MTSLGRVTIYVSFMAMGLTCALCHHSQTLKALLCKTYVKTRVTYLGTDFHTDKIIRCMYTCQNVPEPNTNRTDANSIGALSVLVQYRHTMVHLKEGDHVYGDPLSSKVPLSVDIQRWHRIVDRFVCLERSVTPHSRKIYCYGVIMCPLTAFGKGKQTICQGHFLRYAFVTTKSLSVV